MGQPYIIKTPPKLIDKTARNRTIIPTKIARQTAHFIHRYHKRVDTQFRQEFTENPISICQCAHRNAHEHYHTRTNKKRTIHYLCRAPFVHLIMNAVPRTSNTQEAFNPMGVARIFAICV